MSDLLRSVSTAEPSLEALRRLPPTSEVEAEAEAAKLQADRLALSEDAPQHLRLQLAELLGAAAGKLELCRKRDAIQATRPEGCHCLGVGGAGVSYIPPLMGGEAQPVFNAYCMHCDAGRQARVRDDIARAHYRANRRAYQAQKLFDTAGVPRRLEAYSFDTYPVTAATEGAVALIRQWVREFCERSLLLFGPFGTGKTGLAVAALREAVGTHHVDALFLATPDLLDRIRASYGPRDSDADAPTERELMDAVKDTGLLVLDDLGAERPTGWVQEKLFAVINHRYNEQLPCIFTSNLTPEGLAKHLGERTAWRIVEMSDPVRLDGPNLRDRKGQ
jgi:DNA replication protein DnaC